MRVAYICADPGIPVFGTKGASVHIQEIVRAWRARGHEVHLYCTRQGEDVPADLADVPLTEQQVPVVKAEEREQAQYAAAEYLAAAALAYGVDLVYERYSLFSTALSSIVSEAAGLAIVASRVGQIPHILKDQSTGILVDPSDPTALREALDILAANPALRHTLAAAARQDAVDSHSWESVLTKILQGVPL